MSTILNTNGAELEVPRAETPERQYVVITAQWNPQVTHSLRDGAVETLRKAGIRDSNIIRVEVPGTVELVNAAAMFLHRPDPRQLPAAVIIIGCVIRGDTPHFDYVCQQVATGTGILNAEGKTPVIFGVLTVDNPDQALDRAGGRLGNKGAEAACAAVTMANLHHGESL